MTRQTEINRQNISTDDNIWIIKGGRFIDFDLTGISAGRQTSRVREYEISELARYMLNPVPIEISKKLVGCKIIYKEPEITKIKKILQRILPKKMRNNFSDTKNIFEEFITQNSILYNSLKDKNLFSHFKKISSILKQYNPVIIKLIKIKKEKIEDVIGICDDIGGNQSLLNIQGDINDKINYMIAHLLEDVKIVLEKVYISNGLFEMRGFDFKAFNPANSYRLITFLQDGENKAYVLNQNNKIDFPIEDMMLLNNIHLLGQSVKEDSKFRNTINKCTLGKAEPLKIFFNDQLEINYSSTLLPEIYKEAFSTYALQSEEVNAVMCSIKRRQIGISFNCLADSDTGEDKLLMSISVMHDIQALEEIKDNLPELYSDMSRRVLSSEAGRYYLLDSIRGYQK